MRRGHFEAFGPLCPRCRGSLGIGTILREHDGHIVEAILHCAEAACRTEYPVVDGVPILVADLRTYFGGTLLPLLARDDLSPEIASLIGDAAGPGSDYDTTRQHLSQYVWDHYGDFDPEEAVAGPRPGAAVKLLSAALALAGDVSEGPILDLGCSVGRTTFELAARFDGLVLGVDLNLAMIRRASEVLRTGEVRYDRRRVGIVYDRRKFPAAFPHADRVDFWACDVMALPFADRRVALAACLNLLDCIASPVLLLEALDRLVADGGRALIATPFDWSAGAVAVEGWIGGHSQRGPDRGASEPLLRSLLSPGAHPQATKRLRLTAEAECDWQVRLHDRATMGYRSHVVAATAREA